MKILFVCKYNRLRSKIAENLFRFYTKGSKHEVKSAGIRSYLLSPFMVHRVKQLLEQRGVSIEDESSVIINEYLMKWADKIIIVADDVSKDGFPKDKTEIWQVSDIDDKDDRKVKIKIDEIEVKIKEFVEKLNKNV